MSARGVGSKEGGFPMVGPAYVFSLEEACEVLAAYRGYDPVRVLRAVRLLPGAFFRGARQNGDGSWRVPAADVQWALGGVFLKALSCGEFAEALGCSVDAVERAVVAGVLRKLPRLPRPLSGWTKIPVSELLRCFCEGLNVPGAGAGSGGRRGRGRGRRRVAVGDAVVLAPGSIGSEVVE